jgi:hypothetical protein
MFQHYKIHEVLWNMSPSKASWFNPVTVFFALLFVANAFLAYLGNAVSQGVFIGLCVVAIVTACVAGLSWIGDIVTRNREIQEAKAQQVEDEQDQILLKKVAELFVRTRFEIQHPEIADDEVEYQAWLARYAKYFKDQFDYEITSTAYFTLRLHSNKVDAKFEERIPRWTDLIYFESDRRKYFMDKQTALSGAVSTGKAGFFSKLAEFGSFIWTVLLVKKWKICPIVETPKTT